MIGIPGWMLITAAVFYVSLNACCPYDWVCMRTFPKMIVSALAVLFLMLFFWEKRDRGESGGENSSLFRNWTVVAFWGVIFFAAVFGLAAIQQGV